eukprot:COSAG02_NODE_6089_length_3811_cov_79.446803_2_plen_243_part_00
MLAAAALIDRRAHLYIAARAWHPRRRARRPPPARPRRARRARVRPIGCARGAHGHARAASPRQPRGGSAAEPRTPAEGNHAFPFGVQGGVDQISPALGSPSHNSQRVNLETFNRHHTNTLKAWSAQALHLLAAAELPPCSNNLTRENYWRLKLASWRWLKLGQSAEPIARLENRLRSSDVVVAHQPGGGDYLRINSLRRVEGKCRPRWSGGEGRSFDAAGKCSRHTRIGDSSMRTETEQAPE